MQLHSGNRINPISKNLLSYLVAPTLPGFNNNYFATNSYDTDYNKITEDYLDAERPRERQRTARIRGQLRGQRAGAALGGRGSQPHLPGADLGFDGAQRFAGRDQHARQTLVMDGVFGFTRTDMLARPHTDDCWGDLVGITNSCQAPYSRSTAIPQVMASNLTVSQEAASRARIAIRSGAAR